MKKILLALLSGLLLALAWPTYGFPLLLFLGFVPLLYLEHQLRKSAQKNAGWKIFGLAYLGFFIWNLITTYWLYYSTAAGMAFAILVNTLLMTLVFVLYHKVARRTTKLLSSLFVVSLWMCFEYLHLHWAFSWPWLNLGNGFSTFPQWVQWYEYTGNFGGTLWVWLGNLLVFHTLLKFNKQKNKSVLFKGGVKLFLLIGIPIGISYWIGFTYPDRQNQQEIEVLILQPDIDPYTEKYKTSDREVGQLLFEMTRENISDSTDLVIAPETVYADGTRRSRFKHSAARQYSHKIVTHYPGVSFIGGISLYDVIRNKKEVGPQSNWIKPGLWANYYNSAFMVSPGQPTQIYHKSKLVVGVETFPYQDILKPLLGNIMIDLGGTVAQLTTQPNREVFLSDNHLKSGPLICYESVYGEFVNGYVQNGAQFLVIITNDAWWEDTQGHKQHVSYARLRAIETRRDIAQSANNGTSAIINQKGEIIKKTAYDIRTTLKGKLHLNTGETFYVKHGDYLARIAEILAAIIFIIALVAPYLRGRFKPIFANRKLLKNNK